MRRVSGKHLIGAAIGATFWAAALLLPPIDEVHAQTALGYFHGTTSALLSAKTRQANLPAKDAERELRCLALNVYWEARGEPLDGKFAVAAVTVNRTVHPEFPDSICGVVYQGRGQGRRQCQFSWACDRRTDQPRNDAAWEQSQTVAYDTLYEHVDDPTHGALYFHATRVRPQWSRTMEKTSRIGRHLYYRERGSDPEILQAKL